MWFKSFAVIFAGMVLLLLGDFASKSGAVDPTVFRLAGAALIGLGVCIGLGGGRAVTDGPSRSTRSRKR